MMSKSIKLKHFFSLNAEVMKKIQVISNCEARIAFNVKQLEA